MLELLNGVDSDPWVQLHKGVDQPLRIQIKRLTSVPSKTRMERLCAQVILQIEHVELLLLFQPLVIFNVGKVHADAAKVWQAQLKII